jgi:hypothetical protein
VSLRQTSILQERDDLVLPIRCSQGHHLEGALAIANDVRQGLSVPCTGITDNGSLLWLCQGVAEGLEPPAKAQRVLAHHGLDLRQCLVGNVDSTQLIGKACQLEQYRRHHRVARGRGIVLQVTGMRD